LVKKTVYAFFSTVYAFFSTVYAFLTLLGGVLRPDQDWGDYSKPPAGLVNSNLTVFRPWRNKEKILTPWYLRHRTLACKSETKIRGISLCVREMDEERLRQNQSSCRTRAWNQKWSSCTVSHISISASSHAPVLTRTCGDGRCSQPSDWLSAIQINWAWGCYVAHWCYLFVCICT